MAELSEMEQQHQQDGDATQPVQRGVVRRPRLVVPSPGHGRTAPAAAPRFVRASPGAAAGASSRRAPRWSAGNLRSEEHTSELQSQSNLVCRLLLEKKKKKNKTTSRNKRQLSERPH